MEIGVQPASSPAVLALGFRPFFLLAGGFAVLFLPLWLAVLSGDWTLHGDLKGPAWHAHEMLFGFAGAVIAGFLLTAVRNWTGKPTTSGWPLAALGGLWLLARLLNLWGGALPLTLVVLVDAAFLPAIGVVIALPILRTANWRNIAFPPMLMLLGAVNIMSHLEYSLGASAAQIALDVVVVIVILITGRIVPNFTASALGIEVTRRPTVDKAIFACMAGVLIFDRVPKAESGRALLSLIAGVLLGVRMIGWGTRQTLRTPLLWVLHLGHAWLALGLVLRGVSILAPDLVPGATATHALTVGCIATLILGMMSRVGLGHTGRTLAVGAPIITAFLLLAAAALVRVLVPMASPALLLGGWVAAGALWTAAFGLFMVVYAPILWAPRPDGRAG